MDKYIAFAGAVFVFVIAAYLLRYIYGYKIQDGKIKVLLFGLIRMYEVPIADIKSVRLVGWRELGIGGMILRLGNRIAADAILIEKKSGIFRKVAITPGNPHEFLSEVRLLQTKTKDGVGA